MNVEEIAEELKDVNEQIVLIYAFNATGKTLLSVAYKNATKNKETGEHAGVYYNAFSEDLFVWDNDEENDNQNIRLDIRPSSLNRLHAFWYDDIEPVMEKLALYEPRFTFTFNQYKDIEQGIESVTFFANEASETPIKISRGEERIFVWCFFLALLEVDGWADEQDAHIFIDDPVSSLDEHNIYITANSIFDQIEKHYDSGKRMIITTHHIGLFSILADRLTKGEKSSSYKNNTGLRILKRKEDELILESPSKNVFLFHLHLLQVLDQAKQSQLYTYHFALLRQLLENISSFLGSGRSARTLAKLGVDNADEIMATINGHSHKSAYYYQTEMMSTSEENMFNEIFDKLTKEYKFVY